MGPTHCACRGGRNLDVVDARLLEVLPPPKVCQDCGRTVLRIVLVDAGSPLARRAP